jgi:hypothetical protein
LLLCVQPSFLYFIIIFISDLKKHSALSLTGGETNISTDEAFRVASQLVLFDVGFQYLS